MNNVWKIAAIAAGMASVLSSGAARADDDGSWEIRLRAVYLDPANKSDPIAALEVPANAIHINDKVLPDLDFEYFFTPNWSTELVLTYPQSQKVTVEHSALGGPTEIGTFKHLPPVLTAKYDFLPNSDFQPYLGVGVNFTLLTDVDLNVPTVGGLDLHKRTSWGPAAQAGFDYRIAPHWYLNLDVKWAELRTHATLDGTEISELKVDPLLFGVGIGYRFGAHAAVPVAATPVAATPEPATSAPATATPAAPTPAAPAGQRSGAQGRHVCDGVCEAPAGIRVDARQGRQDDQGMRVLEGRYPRLYGFGGQGRL
jgi:outer membrane protein